MQWYEPPHLHTLVGVAKARTDCMTHPKSMRTIHLVGGWQAQEGLGPVAPGIHVRCEESWAVCCLLVLSTRNHQEGACVQHVLMHVSESYACMTYAFLSGRIEIESCLG